MSSFISTNPVLFWSIATLIFFVAIGALSFHWIRQAARGRPPEEMKWKSAAPLELVILVPIILLFCASLFVFNVLDVGDNTAETVSRILLLAALIVGVRLVARFRRIRSHEQTHGEKPVSRAPVEPS